MAMEIKTLSVKNSEEQRTIEFWSQFGRVLKSSQRVYNKDSHIETRGDRKSTRLNSSHDRQSRMPSSA